MDLSAYLGENLVHAARIALTGRPQDAHALVRKVVMRLRKEAPDLAQQLSALMALAPTQNSPLRDVGAGVVPVDTDSRQALVRSEFPVLQAEEPILFPGTSIRLHQVIAERRAIAKLEGQGLAPARSLLFVGPPGVGKTISARWLAAELGRPLVTLDLATVMSSFLGKTGSNVRSALDYAKSIESILLLDEFDAIAKRRDDETDVGELKRLVNVLLQEIDDWPSTSLLIAATNHGELLDPAVWRRFDEVIQFELPATSEREAALKRLFAGDVDVVPWLSILTELWKGRSHGDIARSVQWIRRRAIVSDQGLVGPLSEKVSEDLRAASASERKRAAALLEKAGFSDRKISNLVGISRDTIRRSRAKA